MTESRETSARRQFRDRATETQKPATQLSRLCIIQGCLNLRVGANLCRTHDAQSAPRTRRQRTPATSATVPPATPG